MQFADERDEREVLCMREIKQFLELPGEAHPVVEMRERLGMNEKAGSRHLADEQFATFVPDPFPRKLVYDDDAGACLFE